MSIDLLFSGARLPFNAAICVVFALSIAWLAYVVAIVAWRDAETIRRLIGDSKPDGYTWDLFQDRFNKLPLHCLWSPVGGRAKQIHDLRSAEIEVENEVSSAISQARLYGRASIVGYAPTAAILMGLLGTLYGLSASVGNIRKSLASIPQVDRIYSY